MLQGFCFWCEGCDQDYPCKSNLRVAQIRHRARTAPSSISPAMNHRHSKGCPMMWAQDGPPAKFYSEYILIDSHLFRVSTPRSSTSIVSINSPDLQLSEYF
jgi:hypothetical protein